MMKDLFNPLVCELTLKLLNLNYLCRLIPLHEGWQVEATVKRV
jgi:hypothetical protein